MSTVNLTEINVIYIFIQESFLKLPQIWMALRSPWQQKLHYVNFNSQCFSSALRLLWILCITFSIHHKWTRRSQVFQVIFSCMMLIRHAGNVVSPSLHDERNWGGPLKLFWIVTERLICHKNCARWLLKQLFHPGEIFGAYLIRPGQSHSYMWVEQDPSCIKD